MSKTILTGLRANQDLHLGNYLGAIKPMVNLQKQLDEGDKLFMFVPDLHSFTTPIDHSAFYQNVIDNVRMFIAAGIDPDNSSTFLYRQSRIPAHSEMTWVLSCFAYFGEASRMTEFKDKSERLGNKSVTLGLFSYPVLMAADILLYDADYVPVGDDQKQHMELTRKLAERMNNKFGDVFTVPKPWSEQLDFAKQEISLRIMSLTDPTKKMSKSVDDPKGTIKLSDSPDEAAKKVMSATTDSIGMVNYDPENQAGIVNLLHIAATLGDKPLDKVKDEWTGNSSYGELKSHVAELVKDFLAKLQDKYSSISDDDVEAVLQRGEEQVTPLANTKLEAVQKVVGLRR